VSIVFLNTDEWLVRDPKSRLMEVTSFYRFRVRKCQLTQIIHCCHDHSFFAFGIGLSRTSSCRFSPFV